MKDRDQKWRALVESRSARQEPDVGVSYKCCLTWEFRDVQGPVMVSLGASRFAMTRLLNPISKAGAASGSERCEGAIWKVP